MRREPKLGKNMVSFIGSSRNQEISVVQPKPKESNIYLYPRKMGNDLVADNQMVGFREHLSAKHRMIFMSGPIGEETDSSNLLMALTSLSNDPLKLVINSPGGYLESTYMFCDTMKLCMKKAPIYTIGRLVASAAVLPFVCSSRRYLMPHSKIMLHLVWGQMQGDQKTVEIQAKEMKKVQDQMIEFLREHGVKKSATDILKDIDRELWMDPKEAIKYGLADEIISPETMSEWLTLKES